MIACAQRIPPVCLLWYLLCVCRRICCVRVAVWQGDVAMWDLLPPKLGKKYGQALKVHGESHAAGASPPVLYVSVHGL